MSESSTIPASLLWTRGLIFFMPFSCIISLSYVCNEQTCQVEERFRADLPSVPLILQIGTPELSVQSFSLDMGFHLKVVSLLNYFVLKRHVREDYTAFISALCVFKKKWYVYEL
jgi:hypothetical protein